MNDENGRLYGTWKYENQVYSGINMQWVFKPDNSWEFHMYNTVKRSGTSFEYTGNSWNGKTAAMNIVLSDGGKKMQLSGDTIGLNLIKGSYIKEESPVC
jgi:hypothetical protein